MAKKAPTAPLVPLRRWYLGVCLFTLRVEGELAQFESELADIESRFSTTGWGVSFRGKADRMRRAIADLLRQFDERLEVSAVRRGASAKLTSRGKRAPSKRRRRKS
jgi:hypothetical protein